MEASPTDNPVLARFHTALDRVYSPRISRVVLYHLRAGGDARPDSGYDIGLFLTNLHSFGRESQALAEIDTEILMVAVPS